MGKAHKCRVAKQEGIQVGSELGSLRQSCKNSTEAQQKQLRRQRHKATARKNQVFSHTTGVHCFFN